ncbi:MAG: stress-induced protein [Rhodospirillales bacterium 20-64-7]|nr:MAG: stress-induced protein [Rhodospirillales bacterium 20-64-7]HQT78636.1 general stress protein [Rhodopila sp.]
MAEERRSRNPGNFAEDRARAARAGHIGGQHSSGNFAHDRERAAEAGRKGGLASHGHARGNTASPDTERGSDNHG